MPKIPTFQQSFVPKSSRDVRNTGSVIAQGLAAFGGDMANAGQQMVQEELKLAETKATTEANDAKMQAKLDAVRIREDVRSEFAETPEIIDEQFHERYQDHVNKNYYEKSSSAAAEGMKREMIQPIVFDQTIGAFKQGKDMRVAQARQSFEKSKVDIGVLAFRGEQSFDESKRDVEEALIASKEVLDPSDYENLIQEGYNEAAFQHASGDIDRNPWSGLKTLNSKFWDEDLTGTQIYNLQRRALAEIKRRETAAKQKKAMQKMTGAELHFDRRDKDHVKGLNLFVEEDTAIIEGMHTYSPTSQTHLSEIVSRSKLIPHKAESLIRAFALSDDPKARAYAADTLDMIERASPQALDPFKSEDIIQVRKENDLLKAGVDPEFARKAVDEEMRPKTEEERAIRKARIDEQMKDIKYEEEIGEIFTQGGILGFFTGDPELPEPPQVRDSILANYQAMRKASVDISGVNDAAAKRETERQFRNTYGVTNVGANKTVVRRPPEKYYAVRDEAGSEIPNDWMGEQLEAFVKLELGQNISEDDIFIVADAQTENGVPTNSPDWSIVVKRPVEGGGGLFEENGAEFITLDKRWRPDPNQALAQRKADTMKLVEEARKDFKDPDEIARKLDEQEYKKKYGIR